jgi:hypothetical protein
MSDEIGRKIKKAAKILQERGWCQNTLEDERGRMCIVGALNAANGEGPTDFKFEEFLYEAGPRILKHLPDFTHPEGYDSLDILMDWNNKICKGKGEVIKLLRKAAKGNTNSDTIVP